MEDFDEFVALGGELIRELPPTSEVDGHDFGVGEFNIFVLTDQPRETLHAAQPLIQKLRPKQQMRAAYREMDKAEFVFLWPPNLREFKVA